MKLSVASIVAFIGLFSQALAADVHHCAGPNSLRCPDGLTCCGPAVDGVGGTCVPVTAGCKAPITVPPPKRA